MEFLHCPTRNLFFTGKGGVGKTSVACASAVRLADQGKRVLLISTDPASNLDEVLGTSLNDQPTPVAGVDNLFAMNLDPEAAAASYRERMVGPYRGLLPAAAIRSMEEQFSGACTLEIAAFDEFASLLGQSTATVGFDHVIFDTAPTGHTLRLLTLPSAWSTFMETNTTGTSCLGPLAGLRVQQRIYRQAMEALSDPGLTTLILVTRPEESALQEAARTSDELAALGVKNQQLLVNAVFRAATPDDPLAASMQTRGESALRNIPPPIAELPRTEIPLAPQSAMGIEQLRKLGTPRWSVQTSSATQIDPPLRGHSFAELVNELAGAGQGVVMTMGKGGVGKTTLAAAIAFALAERGIRVHLSTTDPAAHVATAADGENLPQLTVGRIDPQVEKQRYAEEVLVTAGAGLDSSGRALLEEDLRSPCTEEIAVFRAFAAAVSEGDGQVVVLDTAPTGHTILLLDAALRYHREVTRQSSGMPESVQQLLPRLRDPDFTRILIVTQAEATPVHEAARLQRDLERAAIRPFAWVVNQSLVPQRITDPILVGRRRQELQYVREVEELSKHRFCLVPWHPQPPKGRGPLLALVNHHQDPCPNPL